ncbi:MAG: hypothetical protein P8L68_08975 [Paracoccaceae bacterium]|nr:hypothetical protein [Paracoccaceae bacterium]MDG2258611.1 hypothetical protein [Paracoccaceae bacterium]
MKTATTYLQSVVFSDETTGFGVPGGELGRASIADAIILNDGFSFDVPAVRKSLQSMEEVVSARGLLPIWSEETLTGNPNTGRYDAHSNAVKLKETFPKSKILVTIREQKALARSLYAECLHQGGTIRCLGYFGSGNEPLSMPALLRLDFLKYDKLLQHYINNFGAENVLVLPQEMLRKSPSEYFNRLTAFTGTEPIEHINKINVHGSLSARGLYVARLLNQLFAPDPRHFGGNPRHRFVFDRILRRLDRVIPKAIDFGAERTLSRFIEDRYSGEFSASNANLAELTGLDLAALGYECA